MPPRNAQILIVALILTAGIMPIGMSEISLVLDPTAFIVEYSSVERTWETIDLLYQEQFHNATMVYEELSNMAELAPNIVEIDVIGMSYYSRNITSVRITNEQNPIQKAKTLVVAHHHGREQITVEIALRFILHLVNGYGNDTTLTKFVDTQEIYILPTINPDALDAVVNDGNQLLRKNLRPFDNDGDELFSEDDVEDVNGDGFISRYYLYVKDYPEEEPTIYDFDYSYYEGIDNDGDGEVNEDEVGLVDLNRNYPQYWDNGVTTVTAQTYRGATPFSEPETQVYRDFVLQHRFSMAYSLHSGINATAFVTNELGEPEEPVLFDDIYNDLLGVLPSSFTGYDYAQSQSIDLESATPGGWGEWMYAERGTTVPITFEVYTNASVYEDESYEIILNNSTHMIREWKGLFGYFNPQSEYIQNLWEDILPAFEYFLEMTPRIEYEITAVSRVTTVGENSSLILNLKNLSPRLSSKEQIYVIGPSGEILDTMALVEGNETNLEATYFPLIVDIAETPLFLQIGNNYTGYSQFVLAVPQEIPTDPTTISIITSTTSTSTTTTTSLTTQSAAIPLDAVVIGIGIGVGLIALVIVVIWIKK